jgi:hypothetical protein
LRDHAATLTPPRPTEAQAGGEGAMLRFGAEDAERWAVFSGDYNPIHFDIEQARLLDAGGLVVHGMVALLPIRSRIAAGVATASQDVPWRRFRAIFRLPIPQDEPISLTERGDGEATRFGLRPAGARNDHIRAQYSAAEPEDTAPAPANAVPRSRIEAFAAGYGAAMPAWMALEAATFAELVQSESDPIWEIVRRQSETFWGPVDQRPMVVHASHAVWHRTDPDMTGPAGALALDSVVHSIGEIAVEPVADERQRSLSVRIPIDVMLEGRSVLRIEVGLLVMEQDAGSKERTR